MQASTRELHWVWGTLVVATLGSCGVAEYLRQPLLAVALIMAVAAFKIRLILRHFMELRHGPLGLRMLFDAWTAGCALMIFGVYWLALNGSP